MICFRPLLVLAAAASLAACGEGPAASGDAKANEQQAPRASDEYLFATLGPIRFSYNRRLLSLVELPVQFPIGPRQQSWGVKLLDHARTEQLGQDGCTYGTPPRPRTCNAADEPGLVLTLLERPIGDYRAHFATAGLSASLRPARLDGASGFSYQRTRNGTRTLYRFVPVGERTLMVGEQGLARQPRAFRTALADALRTVSAELR